MVNGARFRGTLVRNDVLGYLCRRICLLCRGIRALCCGLMHCRDCIWYRVTSRGQAYAFAVGMALMAAKYPVAAKCAMAGRAVGGYAMANAAVGAAASRVCTTRISLRG